MVHLAFCGKWWLDCWRGKITSEINNLGAQNKLALNRRIKWLLASFTQRSSNLAKQYILVWQNSVKNAITLVLVRTILAWLEDLNRNTRSSAAAVIGIAHKRKLQIVTRREWRNTGRGFGHCLILTRKLSQPNYFCLKISFPSFLLHKICGYKVICKNNLW